jgi:hypothetical protein
MPLMWFTNQRRCNAVIAVSLICDWLAICEGKSKVCIILMWMLPERMHLLRHKLRWYSIIKALRDTGKAGTIA